jgi:hypothetical protein
LGALTEVIAGRKEVRPAQTEAQATGAIGIGKEEKDAAEAETDPRSARINGITWGAVYMTAIVMKCMTTAEGRSKGVRIGNTMADVISTAKATIVLIV